MKKITAVVTLLAWIINLNIIAGAELTPPSNDILLTRNFDKALPGSPASGWIKIWGTQTDDQLIISNLHSMSPPNSMLLDRKESNNDKAWQSALFLPKTNPEAVFLSFDFLISGGSNDAHIEVELRAAMNSKGPTILFKDKRKIYLFSEKRLHHITLGEYQENKWFRIQLWLHAESGKKAKILASLQILNDGKWENSGDVKTVENTLPKTAYSMLIIGTRQKKRNYQMFVDNLQFGKTGTKQPETSQMDKKEETPRKMSATEREKLFEVPDFKQLPPRVKIISEKKHDGIITSELTFTGAQFNGEPSLIRGIYSRPEKPGKYPGVLQLHGAGFQKLIPKMSDYYAKNGYACLSIDWAGIGNQGGKGSKFKSLGKMATQVAGEKSKLNLPVYKIVDPKVDSIVNGVRFALRSFMFLKSRPEVDTDKLCLSGMSAGAHLSLLILGQEPSIKVAAVKYGTAFIRDMPGYFGGYFGPVSLCPRTEQDYWLSAFDPKYDLPNYKSNILLLSGSDDFYFWMPVVLKTFREIPTAKHLIMYPNDNHGHVWDETVPLHYFKTVLAKNPAFPEIGQLKVIKKGKSLLLSMKVNHSSKLEKVQFVYKTMPKKTFWFQKNRRVPGANVAWTVLSASQSNGEWVATVPAPQNDEQFIAYGFAEDKSGGQVSSDTVEYPEYPKWRGQK